MTNNWLTAFEDGSINFQKIPNIRSKLSPSPYLYLFLARIKQPCSAITLTGSALSVHCHPVRDLG
ncbi:hypothetical protein [Moorena producens]|uniref:hypothetical protein n=1 Tax=Moorena producens TaxID=1155739 RepID=UPI0011EA64DD|nr:hypothetical protein [Moorena producens]